MHPSPVAAKSNSLDRYEMSPRCHTVWDLFSVITGKVDMLHAKIFLGDGDNKVATTIWIRCNAYLDGQVLRYMAKKMPRLNELNIHTCCPGLKNEITDSDLIYFAKRRRTIQYLTLCRIPNVTAVGLLATICTLNNLVEFATDFPINDAHAQALLERHKGLVTIKLARHRLSPATQAKMSHLIQQLQLAAYY